jgi:hypothetical protein
VFPIPNPISIFTSAASSAVGWAWDKVVQGIYTWFANGILLLMEWVWNLLDESTTPRLTEDWFANEMMAPIAGVALGLTLAMMLASAIQAGLAGRPELIVDALKEGPKAIVATALTVVVLDVMLQGADMLAAVVWQGGRDDTMTVLDGLASTMGLAGGGFAATFLGPLALLFGMIGLIVTAVVMFMRMSLLYLVAAFAPIVWSASVSPVMRGSGRRLIHLAVALVLAKPAIVITLAVGMKLLANTGAAPGTEGASEGAAAVGTLFAGFTAIGIAGFSPVVLFRLLPGVEGASSTTGVVGGWGRSAMTLAQGAMLAKSFGASGAASAASRRLPTTSGMSSDVTGSQSSGRSLTGGVGPTPAPRPSSTASRAATAPTVATGPTNRDPSTEASDSGETVR